MNVDNTTSLRSKASRTNQGDEWSHKNLKRHSKQAEGNTKWLTREIAEARRYLAHTLSLRCKARKTKQGHQ